MDRPVILIFISILWTFFSVKSFRQINERSNIFATETLYKNCNVSRGYALDGSFSRVTTNCSRYVDISALTLSNFLNQHLKVNIGSF